MNMYKPPNNPPIDPNIMEAGRSSTVEGVKDVASLINPEFRTITPKWLLQNDKLTQSLIQ